MKENLPIYGIAKSK
jgi:serine/threonine protein kinase